ncbi:hypothetical protein KEM52_000229 [Ascosphaera acerosa]|nr:hypothetical protein KEM52_000229 [Ascosphaera acerosa]
MLDIRSYISGLSALRPKPNRPRTWSQLSEYSQSGQVSLERTQLRDDELDSEDSAELFEDEAYETSRVFRSPFHDDEPLVHAALAGHARTLVSRGTA